MNIVVTGINFRTAPVELREKFALGGDLAQRLLRAIHAENVFEEAIILDTCNRMECYFVPSGTQDPLAYLTGLIARVKGVDLSVRPSEFYCHSGKEAVEHLFRVSAALDSQIVGEHEVLRQVKTAYYLAVSEKTSRFLLNKLMHAAFRTGKRVQTETDLGRGSASVARAAVDMASQIFPDLHDKTAMVVGAGQTGRTAARVLVGSGIGHLIIANRTQRQADELANALNSPEPARQPSDCEHVTCPAALRSQPLARGKQATDQPPATPTVRAISLDQIAKVIDSVDMAVCTTGSPEPLLTYANLAGKLQKRGRPLLIVDIAIPRDVESDLGQLAGVQLYNIDDLDQVIVRNIERREQEIPRAEVIVAREVERFCRWHDSLEVTSTIKQLRQHFEQLQEAQVGRHGKLFSQDDHEALNAFARDMCRKMLHLPTAYLRQLSEETATSDRLLAIDTIRQMFNLDQPENDQCP